MSKTNNTIQLKGVRVNNLKNISLTIPHGLFVVITGVSGSGKSSLAFDTLYAEGQRRYVESLNTYARQFLGRMNKPECDFISGIPPAIAIEQKVISRNPRSTVGTSTEIYDYLRMLYARIGHTYSPISGKEVCKNTIDDVVNSILSKPNGTRCIILSPVTITKDNSIVKQCEYYYKLGYARIEINDNQQLISDILQNPDLLPNTIHAVNLLIDRVVVADDNNTVNRIMDSVRSAFYEGNGKCILKYPILPGICNNEIVECFSDVYECDGIVFEEPSEQMFSFNSPFGACEECGGFGNIIGIDERLVIPDQELSVYDGAVVCWRGEKMKEWKNAFINQCAKCDFPIFTPYYQLNQVQKDYLWHGNSELNKDWNVCIDNFFDMLRKNQYKIQYRVMLARYRGKTTCPKCHGTRLQEKTNYVKIAGKTINELVKIPIKGLKAFFDNIELSTTDFNVGSKLINEIKKRLQFLIDVGLGYLTLNRPRNTLSGGESQRVNLSSSLGSSLVGSLYILDEPSIGLHPRDTSQLICVLKQLRDIGNTVVVVEHDEDIMRAADYIIDIGPEAGRKGGNIVWYGNVKDINLKSFNGESHTINFLSGKESIVIPTSRRPWNHSITIKGAKENNLKNIDVEFPLNVITVVTGVSGSGKSSLVNNILYRALKQHLDETFERPGIFSRLEGDLDMIKRVIFVDQNSIGTSTRSNPVTYIGAYDEIRHLMSEQQLALQMNYTPSYFSFNTPGGRCEECKGEGTVTIEMQFMNDLVLECESCHGKRFKKDILDVKFEGQNINDILDMTINQAIEFFKEHNQTKILKKLMPLQEVGLGYLKLGQSSSTLSGGENQRVKLAYYLSQERSLPTLFIFDEPTTGLHMFDIKRLLKAFDALIKRGHTVIIIEHNIDVIKSADHIIDLGPEGGDMGGEVVAIGKPEDIINNVQSHTGFYLKQKMNNYTV